MPQIIEPKDPQPSAADTQASPEDRLAVQREALKRSLDAIAAEVTAALNDAGLAMTVFLTVPSSGDALMTFASPMDPSDDDWSRASQMVCSIVGGKVGVAGLRARPVPCAAAGSAMGAADVSVREASGFGVPTLEQAAKAVSDRAAGGLSSGSPQTS